jgi:site-specific recombinase XerD
MNKVIQRSTFCIRFLIIKSKINKNGEHPIYCRVTSNGKRKEFATGIWVMEKKWNSSGERIIGTTETSQTFNYTLSSIRNNLFKIKANLLDLGKKASSEIVVNHHLGKTEKKHTLIEAHNYYNNRLQSLIGKDCALGTFKRYETSKKLIEQFLKEKKFLSDIDLNELGYSFAVDYSIFLRTVRNCGNNTTIKYINNLKAVINAAVENEWLQLNPISRFTSKLDRIEKIPLTEQELNAIENKEFNINRLIEVRDVFIFCCYTGIAYADVEKLSSENIFVGITGKKQIRVFRTKTETEAVIPLLNQASIILEKYRNHPVCVNKEKLLPVLSNQKYNSYLKEIADRCDIKKTITTHTARHTFATLMLTKKVSIEAVSSMLGHTNIKTTQVYAKVIEAKVISEMEIVNKSFQKDVVVKKKKKSA